jgi:hypothetical protein
MECHLLQYVRLNPSNLSRHSLEIASASRFLVKEIADLGSSYSRVKRTIEVFGEGLASGDDGRKIPESFSVPDDPPAWLAHKFLESIKKDKKASQEKLQWLTRYFKQNSLQRAWLTKFGKKLHDFAWNPSPACEKDFADTCRENGSLLVEDAKTAKDFISLITEIVINYLHKEKCIGVKPKDGSQKVIVEEPAPAGSAAQPDAFLNEALNSGKSRRWKHMGLAYNQPKRSGRESKPAEKETGATYMYHWLFLSFFTLTLYRSGMTEPSCSTNDNVMPLADDGGQQAEIIAEIVLCFDNANGEWIEDAIKKLDLQPSGERQLEYPSRVFPRILEAVSQVYDRALWGFRVPIRNIEKV